MSSNTKFVRLFLSASPRIVRTPKLSQTIKNVKVDHFHVTDASRDRNHIGSVQNRSVTEGGHPAMQLSAKYCIQSNFAAFGGHLYGGVGVRLQ